MKRAVLIAMFSLAGLSACTGSARRASSRLEGRYVLGEVGDGWQAVRTGGADYAWFHPDLAATIYADSNCLARYEDGELGDLLGHLVAGIRRGPPTQEQVLTLDDREAMVRRYQGQLDGVKVEVAAMATKKDECLYDVVLIAPPRTFQESWSTFESVIRGFATGGG